MDKPDKRGANWFFAKMSGFSRIKSSDSSGSMPSNRAKSYGQNRAFFAKNRSFSPQKRRKSASFSFLTSFLGGDLRR
jgi:hypothetical protein